VRSATTIYATCSARELIRRHLKPRSWLVFERWSQKLFLGVFEGAEEGGEHKNLKIGDNQCGKSHCE